MTNISTRTFTELTTPELLEIHDLGTTPLSYGQICGLWSVINYRFENLLPTVTYTDKKPFELSKSIGGDNTDGLTLACAIVGRMWEMGVKAPQ